MVRAQVWLDPAEMVAAVDSITRLTSDASGVVALSGLVAVSPGGVAPGASVAVVVGPVSLEVGVAPPEQALIMTDKVSNTVGYRNGLTDAIRMSNSRW